MSEQPGPSDPTALVDWEFAVKVGSRFAGEGPEISYSPVTITDWQPQERTY